MITLPLTNETLGQVLNPRDFSDLYLRYFDEGQQCFSRQANSDTELVIVFPDIEDFDRSLGEKTSIEWKAYKNRLLLLVWTQTDPIQPLGFPISFQCDNKIDQDKVEQLLLQSEIKVHYITLMDNELFHIFSQTVVFDDKKYAEEAYLEARSYLRKEARKQEEILIKDLESISDLELNEQGIGYLLDYTSLLKKSNEEKAKEKLMGALISTIELFKAHPRPEIRECKFMIWVGERKEKQEGDFDSILLEIFMTPSLAHLFDVVNDNQLEENPLSTVLLSFPEFLTTIEEKPIKRGAYPFIQYENGKVSQIHLDEKVAGRLESLRTGL